MFNLLNEIIREREKHLLQSPAAPPKKPRDIAPPEPMAPPAQPSTHINTPPSAHAPVYSLADKLPPAPSIAEIAAKLPPQLVPLRENGRIVHNSAKIAAKCGNRHIHSYFITDVDAGKVTCCPSCTLGTVFMKNVRSLAENLLEVPFALDDGHEFYNNPVLDVSIYPIKTGGDDYSKTTSGGISVYIHNTRSAPKIMGTLARELSDYPKCAHLRTKLERYLPKEPRYAEDPPDLPVISRGVNERLCIDS